MATNLSKPSSSIGGSGGRAASSREGSAKAVVAEQISQAVQSTSNLLHLMQESSPSQVHLAKLPRNLLSKTSTIKNTEQILEQMPRIISALDAHLDNGLQSVPHLKTVTQLLANMESCLCPELHPRKRSRWSRLCRCLRLYMDLMLVLGREWHGGRDEVRTEECLATCEYMGNNEWGLLLTIWHAIISWLQTPYGANKFFSRR